MNPPASRTELPTAASFRSELDRFTSRTPELKAFPLMRKGERENFPGASFLRGEESPGSSAHQRVSACLLQEGVGVHSLLHLPGRRLAELAATSPPRALNPRTHPCLLSREQS